MLRAPPSKHGSSAPLSSCTSCQPRHQAPRTRHTGTRHQAPGTHAHGCSGCCCTAAAAAAAAAAILPAATAAAAAAILPAATAAAAAATTAAGSWQGVPSLLVHLILLLSPVAVALLAPAKQGGGTCRVSAGKAGAAGAAAGGQWENGVRVGEAPPYF
jgi:hypothetical protein